MSKSKKMHCAVVGAKGYSGQQLCQLLLAHSGFQVCGVFSRSEAWRLPIAPQLPVWPTEQLAKKCQQIELLFLATPAEVSAELIPIALAAGVKVIDLSGACRLPDGQHQRWYPGVQRYDEILNRVQDDKSAPNVIPATEPGSKDQPQKAVYGLQPFCQKQLNADTPLIANPGCYATAAQMALVPLAKAGCLQEVSITIDAKSGVSGAGKKASESLLFCELSDNFYPYKIGKHQHTPEIENSLSDFAGQPILVLLTTQLLPVVRGIAMTIYLNKAFDPEQLAAAYQADYQDYPLVQTAHLPELSAEQQAQFLGLTSVTHTPNTHIGYQVVGDQTLLFVTLDNLMKGAASQAMENAECLLTGEAV